MRYLSRLFILAAVFLSCGCAFMDFSTLDTAVPLSPKQHQVSIGIANGYDVSGLYYESGPEGLYEDDINGWIMAHGNMAFSLNPENDLIFRASVMQGGSTSNKSESNYGSLVMKAGLKHLLSQKGHHYTSILPSVFYIAGDFRSREDNVVNNFDYLIRGMELQLLQTYQPSKFFSASLIGRGDFYVINKTINGDERGPFMAGSFGMRSNLKFSLWYLYLIPELGFEVFPIVNGDTIVKPTTGLGLGFEF